MDVKINEDLRLSIIEQLLIVIKQICSAGTDDLLRSAAMLGQLVGRLQGLDGIRPETDGDNDNDTN